MSNTITKEYDFIVVGGGLSGVCAAISAARLGIKTALIHNRPVLGGNASSEVRMHICGADYHASRINARETGLIEELLLHNRYVNPQHSFSVLDAVLWEKTGFQDNLDLYLNTHMNKVFMEKAVIRSIECFQMTTEKNYNLQGKLFADTTGDATLSVLAGAQYMSGKEERSAFNDSLAPEPKLPDTMGSSIMLKAVDMGYPVPFKKPFWARSFTEDELKYRDHTNFDFGYWWIELGGDKLNTISDAEEIRDELLKSVYGIWNHIKNGGEHGADNYALEWVGALPGKRESRRVIGDYILSQQDIDEGRIFEDTIAYGGWPMDIHASGGLNNSQEPTKWNTVNDLYTIPYRCIYARDIENLFVGGRAISASHVAFSSTRVMATCAVIGQAIGTAASILIKSGKCSPSDLNDNIRLLQDQLMRDDCYLLGFCDTCSLLKDASAASTSYQKGYEPQNVIDGWQRDDAGSTHMWRSKEEDRQPALEIRLPRPTACSSLVINFNSNLSKEIMITSVTENKDKQRPGFPPELVKDYSFCLYDQDENLLYSDTIRDNIYRHREHKFDTVYASKIVINIQSTHGSKTSDIYEVKLYNS